MIYCPYTDRDIQEAQSSPEHIIPLSLGGINGLEISVDSAVNSQVGSKLDGALANEFVFALKRTKFDTRGHSGKKPTALIRKATYGEDRRPAQVHFHSNEGLKVWDSRDGEFKERVPRFEISGSIDIDLPVRFAAKVALAAGYYAYGDLFRENVDHQQFRDVMNTDLRKLDLTKTPADLGLRHLTLRVDSQRSGSAGSSGGQLQPAGQLPAVRSADGAVTGAVRGGRLDGYLPSDVLALLQPPCLHHLAARHREGVVPQGLEAKTLLELLAESQLEGELALPVMGVRRAVNGGCQRRPGGYRDRRRTGEFLAVAPVVGEAHRDPDGPALVGRRQGIGGAGGTRYFYIVGQPLVAEGGVVQPVLVRDARRVRGQGLAHLGRAADRRSSPGPGWPVPPPPP